MDSYASYQTLKKPWWSPPAWIFGPVWTVLYVIIAISFGTVFYRALTGAVPLLVALPFILNLVFNFSFTYFQFGLKNNYLAAVDILLVLITLIWAMLAIYSASPELLSAGGSDLQWAALANIPYLLWVAFATMLQLTVTYLNR